jgi:hypothetical protein
MLQLNDTINEALLDPDLLGAALGNPAPWATWLVVLQAAFGLQLDDDQGKVFAEVAGARSPPTKRVRELWAVVGRRGGKSRIASALAVYIALFCKHKLAPGETGMVLILAASVAQSKMVFDYVKAFLEESSVLRNEIDNITKEEITLRNGIVISSHANSFRTVRGRTLCAAIFDEVSYWRDDTSAMPDAEVYSAVLPSLITTNGMLIGISSPYRKVGLLHGKHKSFFGVSSDEVLVVQGSSQSFNKTLTDEAIAAQKIADPTAAASEWDAEFRADLVGFLDDAVIDRAIDHNRPLELPYRRGENYFGFTDPSGGAIGGDSYSIAIVHKEEQRFIVDVVRGRPGPFDPQEVTREYAELCREYKISTVIGDLYGHQWTQQAWRENNMTYVPSDLSASMLYMETLPLFSRGLVSLPNHPVLIRELRLLERIPGRVGKDQVTHPRNAHDDLANATCGALRTAANYMGYNLNSGWLDEGNEREERIAQRLVFKTEAEFNLWRVMNMGKPVPNSYTDFLNER